MRYLIALMLAASICLGGCAQPQPPAPDNTDKTEVVTPERMPPPVRYDEK